jgi:hypothetical protein
MDAGEERVDHGEVIAQAAQASADDTVAAIDAAAELNEDPQVAEALNDAALQADKTSSRVSWLRGFISRLFSRPTPA